MDVIIDFISLVLKLAVPLTLAALAGTLSERSGVINIGLEGTMLMGAFFAAVGAGLSGNPWVGVLFALLIGVMMGLLHAFFCLTLHGHQVVIGVAVNLFATGITPLLTRLVWNREGASDTLPSIAAVSVPLLKDIPVIGKLFTNQPPFVFITLFIFIVLFIFMKRTKYGLRLRMIGDHPTGAQTQGINVKKYKYFAVMVSGSIAALGGAYLSIAHSNVFVLNMVAGRGFMGMAANIFGGWTIGGSALASLFFAAVQSTRYYLIGSPIPDQFVLMIPYVATLIILTAFSRNSRSPEGLGKI
ncbi:MAG TPA: ABC transporter permease [Clostridiaceae bacterium]|nr:ABC transporter permease [Clostridiaceae bacterium]